MRFAVRRRYIAVNPCPLLTRDDRPATREPKTDHVWSDEEIEALTAAAERLARKPEARYDYTPLIRVALSTGLRLGELLGKFCRVRPPSPEAGRDCRGQVLRPWFGDVPRPQVRDVGEADTGIGLGEADRSS